MSSLRIKEKLSSIVQSQLPEFIQTDYTTFVSFIEAYYRFLEQDQSALELVQNARSYNDIDSTTEDFVKYFFKNYAALFPEDSLIDKRFLVKKIDDIYTAKGSSLSFDVLFRVLYDTTVEIKTPFDFVLRASDGKWSERVSLRIRTTTGDRSVISNRLLSYTFGGIVYETPITEVKNLTSELTEIFLDKNFISPSYTIGDTVQVFDGSGSLLFSGTIDPTITSFSILRAGSGFKVGQIYNISYKTGLGSIIKVTSVTSTGGISSAKIIFYGYGFDAADTPFSLDLDPAKNISEISDFFADFTDGFIENFNLTLIDPTSQDYFAEDYVPVGYTGSVLTDLVNQTTITNTIATISSKPANIATLLLSLGALGRYPGQFTTENGFLSELDVRLQDSQLYQPFAYQTNTDIDREFFFDVIKKLVHPTGQNLFNNRLLTSNISLIGNVSVFAESNISFEARDTIEILEDTEFFIEKLLPDDSFESTDLLSITFNKNINNNISVVNTTDTGNVLVNAQIQDYVEQTYFSEPDYVLTALPPTTTTF